MMLILIFLTGLACCRVYNAYQNTKNCIKARATVKIEIPDFAKMLENGEIEHIIMILHYIGDIGI